MVDRLDRIAAPPQRVMALIPGLALMVRLAYIARLSIFRSVV